MMLPTLFHRAWLIVLAIHLPVLSFCQLSDPQTATFPAPVKELLALGYLQFDSLKYDQALANANRVEQLINASPMPDRYALAHVYLLQGICFVKIKSTLAPVYYEKSKPTDLANAPALLAGYQYFGGVIRQLRGRPDSALYYYALAEDTYRTLPENERFFLPRLLSNKAVIATNANEIAQALSLFGQAETLWLKKYNSEHPSLSILYTNRGLTLMYTGNYDKAQVEYLHSLDILQRNLPDDHLELTIIQNNLGLNYTYKWDSDRALHYLWKSAQSANKRQELRLLAAAYNNIGLVFNSLDMPDSSLVYAWKTFELEKQIFGNDSVSRKLGIFFLGGGLLRTGKVQEAIPYLMQAFRLELFSRSHLYDISMMNELAFAYRQMGNLDSARHYNLMAVQVATERGGINQNVILAQGYCGLAMVETARGNPEKATEYIDLALKLENYTQAGAYDSAFYSIDWVLFMEIKCRAEAALYRQSPTESHLRQWQATCLDAINGSLYFRNKLDGPQGRSAILKAMLKEVGMALEANQELNKRFPDPKWNQLSFELAEKTKALELLEATQRTRLKKVLGVPDSVIEFESQLRQAITGLENNLHQLLQMGNSAVDEEYTQYASQLYQYKEYALQLDKNIVENYPRYASLTAKAEPVSLESVQKTVLKPGQSLVEYVVSDSSIHAFVVSTTGTEVIAIKRDFSLEDMVNQFTRDGIYGYLTQNQSLTTEAEKSRYNLNYTEAGRLLYQKLWQPLLPYLSGNQVVIIPDGILSYIPFEALITREPTRKEAFGTYAYLLEDFEISYCYSATMLAEMQLKRRETQPLKPLLAVAPFTYTQSLQTPDANGANLGLAASFAPLRFSMQEVTDIAKIMKGDAVTGKKAGVAYFTANADKYRALHLSTHAIADERYGNYAFLALGNPADSSGYDPFFVSEIYNLSLQADLVFLSACQTGFGKLQKGEGIISLARAFAYAGAKAIVTTLWSVKDQQTASISVAFYKNLAAGNSKSQALREAKLSFLSEARGKGSFSHPYYWAGIVGIGDMQ